MELTRKDRLCANVIKLLEKFGKQAFDIIPETYVLPDEFADFYCHFHSLKAKDKKSLWIVKPSAASRGKGIYLVIIFFLSLRLMIFQKYLLMKTVSLVDILEILSSSTGLNLTLEFTC